MRTLFTNARVFDATGPEITDGEVVVEDGLIIDVGASGLDGDVSIDLGGSALLPGFFDCHVHVMFDGVDLFGMLQSPFSLRFFQAAGNLEKTLAAGITSVRDAGGADLGVKEAVDRGLVKGPRMQIALTMLSQTGGHGDGWMPSGGHLRLLQAHPGLPTNIVDGPDEMRRKVREVIRMGADVIKVATSGGVLSPRDDPRHPHFSPDELDVLVAEAAMAGRWVMAHAQSSTGIKNAVRAGIRSIEHGIYLDDEAIDLMLEHDTWLVPTLVAPTGVLRAAAAGAGIPQASIDKAAEVIDDHRASFRRAVEAGVKVAMGTDSAVTPHGENLDELVLMAEGGMSPPAVLRSTTQGASQLLGVDDRLGTLEPGKLADMVVVSGDPFELTGLRDRVEAVYMAGQPVFE